MSQQSSSLQFDSGNLTNILVILLIIGLGVYVYFELQKIKNRLSEVENIISQSAVQNDPMIQTTRVNNIQDNIRDDIQNNIQDNILDNDESKGVHQVSPMNEFTPLPNDEQEPSKQINIEEQKEQKELSEDEIQALMDDEPLSEMSDDNHSNASSDVMGVLASLKKSEEPAESLNMDEDNIPEAIFENIHNAIENITNLSEQAMQKDTDKETGGDTTPDDTEKDYSKMTVNQLKNILTDLELPTSGNKTKLIERIQQNKSLKI
tara:strand:- start:359 stop:1147 length:789 start_codon:yes stop_codon:yes gene_type:complete